MSSRNNKIISCLCGGIQLKTKGLLRHVSNCHCSQCMKTHGNYTAYTNAQEKEITQREYNDFFRLNDYMKNSQKNEKIQKIKNLFISDKEFKKIVDQVANTQLKEGGNNVK